MTDEPEPTAAPAEPAGSFREFAQARRVSLRRTAYLICGDWHLAEDLVQDALARLYLHWDRVGSTRSGPTDRAIGSLDAYVRRMLVNGYLQARRRPWRREVLVGFAAADQERRRAACTGLDQPDDGTRADVLHALAALGPSQRAVLVLRYWEDLSVEETARVLGCSTGNVKSQTARGLAHLRSALTAEAFERDHR